jgi:hypothetical protein
MGETGEGQDRLVGTLKLQDRMNNKCSVPGHRKIIIVALSLGMEE